MNKELNEVSEMSQRVELMLLHGLLQNNIEHCSMTLLAMSRVHLITTEEMERIYTNVSKYSRGGFPYGQKSLNDDFEQFSESIRDHSRRNDTIKLFYLPKCQQKDYVAIETDEMRLKLYFDYTNFGKNPDVPTKLMNLSASKSRYCFASASRDTKRFCCLPRL